MEGTANCFHNYRSVERIVVEVDLQRAVEFGITRRQLRCAQLILTQTTKKEFAKHLCNGHYKEGKTKA